jgi:membrane-associated phospholipid phosphatase
MLVLAYAKRRRRRLSSILLVLPGTLAISSCATLPDGHGWGQDATVRPGWQAVQDAAAGAAESPRFWGPLVAAAVFQIDGWDRRVSNWARDHTPIFGSMQNAVDWSNRLRAFSSYAYYASVLVTPSGDDPGQWVLDKLRGAAVGEAAVLATDEESALLKSAAARERPNGQDTQSMPSSHTSRSAVLTELAERDLQSLALSDTTRQFLDVGLDALTYGTAWARVESGFHYPSDTLVGMSLGNLSGAFFNDAFLGLQRFSSSVSLAPLPRGAMLSMQLRY